MLPTRNTYVITRGRLLTLAPTLLPPRCRSTWKLLPAPLPSQQGWMYSSISMPLSWRTLRYLSHLAPGMYLQC